MTAWVPGKAQVKAEMEGTTLNRARRRDGEAGLRRWALNLKFVGHSLCDDPQNGYMEIACQTCVAMKPADDTFSFVVDLYPDPTLLLDWNTHYVPGQGQMPTYEAFLFEPYGFSPGYCDWVPGGIPVRVSGSGSTTVVVTTPATRTVSTTTARSSSSSLPQVARRRCTR